MSLIDQITDCAPFSEASSFISTMSYWKSQRDCRDKDCKIKNRKKYTNKKNIANYNKNSDQKIWLRQSKC